MINYKDLTYAAGRLVGTIIRRNGIPILVTDLGPHGCYFKNMLTGATEQDVYPSNSFDITPVPLGNANYNGKSYYLSRIPMRKDWKQGLRASTTRISSPGIPFIEFAELPNVEIARAILGDYPSLDKTIYSLKTSAQVTSMAFDRCFALDKENNIWHKGVRNIGKLINPHNHSYSLKDEFFWARESLEEALQ